jgi:hypothetical protein
MSTILDGHAESVHVDTGFSFSSMTERKHKKEIRFIKQGERVLSEEEVEILAKMIARWIHKNLRAQNADIPIDESTHI